MKKLLTLILTLALAAAAVFAGCTEYKPPASDAEKPGNSVDNPDPVDPPPTDDEDCFTVTLHYLGEKFVPENLIYAQWSDGTSVHRAKFGSDGVAKATGLDGDYVVTLSALPDGFTYEPNGYTATNDSKDTVITLYKLNAFSNNKDGSDFYSNIIRLPSTGAYRVTFLRPNQTIYFVFEPSGNGIYVFQSLISVTANDVNPVLYRHIAPQVESLKEKYDGGGYENTYTKNFKYTIYLDNTYVGNEFKFSIQAESIKKEAFPLDIDFILERDGEYSDGASGFVPVEPTEDFKMTPEYAGKTFKLAALYNNKIQDGSRFKLNPEDGYYHLYDEATGTYGAILYATITRTNEILGSYLTYDEVLYRLKYYGKSYFDFILSYARYVNSDGVYAVTQELKEFLQLHSIVQGYFRDGKGNAETLGYKSGEDDQWLWACGYYS